MCWQEEQWARCPGCGQPRDEVWVDEPGRERSLRSRFVAEPHLCVACDEIAQSQQRFAAGRSAYAGGVYHVLHEYDD